MKIENSVLQIILETIWLLLPAGVANTAPVFAAKYNWLPNLNRPISARLFGSNKTWRGIAVGIIFGSITGLLLNHGAILGAALGFGALAGDAAKSFFKRRLKIAPGQAWPVFDQIDFAVGALLVASFFTSVSLAHILAGLIIFSLLSLLTSIVGMKLKMKKSL